MRLLASSVLLTAALVLYGCDSEPADTSPADANIEAPSAENEAADSADDLLHETGLVTHVEDNGYPTYTFTIQFRAGQPGFDLTANVAELDLGDASPESLTGKTVNVDYVSGEEPDLMDMRVGDHSVLGGDAPEETDPSWKSITGTLSGAEEVVGADLPDEITVTAANGQKLTFSIYVNPEMLPANGKTVTAFYGTRHFNRIVRLQP